MTHAFFALFDPATDATLEKFSVTLGGVAAGVYYIRELFKRRSPHPPNEQLDQAQLVMNERLAKHDEEISNLWNTMRAEDTATRNQLSKAIQDFEGSIGTLDGTLKQVNQTMQLLLQRGLK